MLGDCLIGLERIIVAIDSIVAQETIYVSFLIGNRNNLISFLF
jgi:hypothetical protein